MGTHLASWIGGTSRCSSRIIYTKNTQANILHSSETECHSKKQPQEKKYWKKKHTHTQTHTHSHKHTLTHSHTHTHTLTHTRTILLRIPKLRQAIVRDPKNMRKVVGNKLVEYSEVDERHRGELPLSGAGLRACVVARDVPKCAPSEAKSPNFLGQIRAISPYSGQFSPLVTSKWR